MSSKLVWQIKRVKQIMEKLEQMDKDICEQDVNSILCQERIELEKQLDKLTHEIEKEK